MNRARLTTGCEPRADASALHRNPRRAPPRPDRPTPGFTLIEIILVLAILAAVLAVSAPSLGRFFRGRNLDSEAYRLMALTRHAQDRAVTEGIPMILWLDLDARRYGLLADPVWSIAPAGSRAGRLETLALGTPAVNRTVLQDDPKAVDFQLADDLEFEVELDNVRTNTMGLLDIQETKVASRPMLRFQPDGYLPSEGPRWILLRHRQTQNQQADSSRLWIAPGPSRVAYEIWTNQPPVTLW